MTQADRENAEQVHQQAMQLLEEMNRNLKISIGTFEVISMFVRSVEGLLDKATKGDLKALDEARRHVRWMEANYHMTPSQLRQKMPLVQTGDMPPKSSQELLALLRPPTSWEKYRDIVLTSAVSAAVTAIVTVLVLRFI